MQDITLEDGELSFSDGDFAFGESDEQHIAHIIVAQKGNYRQHPLVGVGIGEWLGSPNSNARSAHLQQRIRLQLEYDGYRIERVDMGGGIENVTVKAKR